MGWVSFTKLVQIQSQCHGWTCGYLQVSDHTKVSYYLPKMADPQNLFKKYCSSDWLPTPKSVSWGEGAQACVLLQKEPLAESVWAGVGCLTICELGWTGSKRVTGWSRGHLPRPMQIGFGCVGGGFNTGKMAPTYRLQRRRVQQRNNGGCPSSPCAEVTQLSLFLYVCGTSWAASPLLEPRVSACKGVSLCMGPLRGPLHFQLPSVSPRWSESLLIFTVTFMGTSLPNTRILGHGAPVWCQSSSLLQGDVHSWDSPADVQPPQVGMGPACFMSPSILSVSMLCLLYTLVIFVAIINVISFFYFLFFAFKLYFLLVFYWDMGLLLIFQNLFLSRSLPNFSSLNNILGFLLSLLLLHRQSYCLQIIILLVFFN